MGFTQIVRAYELKSLGGDKVVDDLTRINNLFIDLKKNKVDLNALAKIATVEDPAKLAEINKQLGDLKVKEKELQVELKKKQVLAKEAAIAAKLESTELIELRAKETKLNITRKEAQIQKQKDIDANKAARASNQALAGSYNEIAAKYKELLSISKNVTPLGNKAETDAAVQELRKLKFELDNFNRALSSDGTLIGEYSAGIVEAFKRLGLGDLIEGQTKQAKAALDLLDKEFLQLRTELREIQATGKGSLGAVEAQLIENRNAAEQFRNQLTGIEKALHDTNQVGANISSNISAQFKAIKEDFVGFVVAYFGFQEAISKGQQALKLNVDFEKATDDLQAITGVAGEGLEFLKQKAREDVNFAAEATINAYKTIVSQRQQLANDPLGLEQVRKSAVLLAQASGEELEPTVKSLIGTMNQFDATAAQSVEIVDALAAGSKAGAAEVGDISAALSEFGTQAKSANISVQESVALIEVLAEKNIKGAEAGTKLRNVLLALSATPALDKRALNDLERAGVDIKVLGDSTIPLRDRLQELAKVQDNNTALVRVFGKENFNAGQIVLQNIPRYADLLEQIQKTGVAQEQAAIATDNAKTKFQQLLNTFANFATNDTINGVLTILIGLLTFLTGNLPLIITLTALYTTGLALQNAELVVLNVNLFVLNARIALMRITLAAVTIAQTAYSIVLQLTTRATTAATAATGLLGVAMRLLPLGIILTLVGLLAGAFSAMATSISQGSAALQEQARLAKLNADLLKQADDSVAGVVSKTQSLVKAITSENTAYDVKNKLLGQLKSSSDGYLNGLTLANIATAEGTKLLGKYITALKDKAIAEAAAGQRTKAISEQLEIQREAQRAAQDNNFAKQKYRDLSAENGVLGGSPFLNSLLDAAKFGTLDAEQAFLKQYYKERADAIQKNIEFYDTKITADIVKSASKTEAATAGSVAARRKFLEDEIKELKTDYEQLDATNKAGQDKNLAQRKAYEKELKELDGNDGPAPRPGRISTTERNALNDLDAARDEQLANEKIRFQKLKKQHEITEQEELDHLDKLQAINTDANKKKIALITGNNPAEKKARAELRLKDIEDIRVTEDAKYKIQLDALNSSREKLQQAAQEKLNNVEEDPSTSDLQRAAAKANFYDTLVTLQTSYNAQATDLDRKYGVTSKKIEDERSKALIDARKLQNKQLAEVTRQGAEEEIEEIRARSNAAMDKIYADIYEKAAKIFANRNLSSSARGDQVKKLENEGRQRVAQQLLAQYDAEVAANRSMLDQKTIDEQEYNKRSAELNKKRFEAQQALNAAEVQAAQEKQRRIQDITNAGERIARLVVTAYIDGLNRKLDADTSEKESYLSKLKDERLAQADSEEERAAIEAEFTERNKQLQREHNEEAKEIKKKQLTLEAAVAVARAIANGLEIGGPAGLAFGLVQGAIVAAEFATQLAILDSQKFAQGGDLSGNRSVLTGGGMFNGPSHAGGGIPLMLPSGAAEVEGGEGFVIKQKSMQSGRRMTVTGTPAQIASAANIAGGGINFAPGAAIRSFAYGGYLGGSLQAPVYVSAGSTGGSNNDTTSQQIAMLLSVAQAQMARIDNMRVTLVPSSVGDANKEREKRVNLGTL